MTATLAVVVLFVPTAASAGTLTGATFAVNDANAYTSARNTQYSWGFTTASGQNYGQVTATVPAGTSGVGERYFEMNESENGTITTPDSAANSITGSMTITADIRPYGWRSWGLAPIMQKEGPNGGFYFAYDNNGSLGLAVTDSAGNDTWYASSNLPFADGQRGKVRVEYTPST